MCRIMEELQTEAALKIAFNLLSLGTVSKEDIAKATGLSLKTIQELADSVNQDSV